MKYNITHMKEGDIILAVLNNFDNNKVTAFCEESTVVKRGKNRSYSPPSFSSSQW